MDSIMEQKNKIKDDGLSQEVDINVILDRSGSMTADWPTTIATLSDFLFKQKLAFPNATYTITVFNDTVDVYANNVKLSDFKGLNTSDITPDGLTALYKAVIVTCRKLRLKKLDARKFVVIVTDGQDNRSGEGAQKSAFDIVGEQKNDGVEFFFLGAGIDSFTEANKIGIQYAANISLDKNGPNNLGDNLRTLSDGICQLVRTSSAAAECPELVRAYTAPQKPAVRPEKKVKFDVHPAQPIKLTRCNADTFSLRTATTSFPSCSLPLATPTLTRSLTGGHRKITKGVVSEEVKDVEDEESGDDDDNDGVESLPAPLLDSIVPTSSTNSDGFVAIRVNDVPMDLSDPDKGKN